MVPQKGRAYLVDNDIFQPHNNARHGLIYHWLSKKNELLAWNLAQMAIAVKKTYEDVREAINNIKEKVLFIDSTASLSVRNFLSRAKLTGPVVNTSLLLIDQYMHNM